MTWPTELLGEEAVRLPPRRVHPVPTKQGFDFYMHLGNHCDDL